jgi:hypothetical protein
MYLSSLVLVMASLHLASCIIMVDRSVVGSVTAEGCSEVLVEDFGALALAVTRSTPCETLGSGNRHGVD